MINVKNECINLIVENTEQLERNLIIERAKVNSELKKLKEIPEVKKFLSILDYIDDVNNKLKQISEFKFSI